MLIQELMRLPRSVLAVARKVFISVFISFPVWARQIVISIPIWARHCLHFIKIKIASVKVGWVSGLAYQSVVDPGGVSFAQTIARRHINNEVFKSSSRLAVILALGQSNIANEGDPEGLYTPGPGVYNFNFLDGHCYVAKCPLLGASANRSNFVTRLGDLLIQRSVYDRVLLVPIGYGGTSITDWAPRGRMNFRQTFTLELLNRAGIEVTHAIFQQGESEGSQENPDGKAWAKDFNLMMQAIRLYGMVAPIFVAQCSVCRCSPNEIIRAAQRSVVDPARGIVAGPDIDTIGLDERWDRCHFSIIGLDKAAQLWFDVIAHHQTASDICRN